jgi:hypothetical protein
MSMRTTILFACLLASCTPSTTAPPAPDASSPAAAACANLARAGCPLGADPLCTGRVELAVRENHVRADKVACAAAAAPAKDAIAACSPYFTCP